MCKNHFMIRYIIDKQTRHRIVVPPISLQRMLSIRLNDGGCILVGKVIPFDGASFGYDMSVVAHHAGEIFDDVEDSFWFIHKLIMDVKNEQAPIKNVTLTTCRLCLCTIPFVDQIMLKVCYVG